MNNHQRCRLIPMLLALILMVITVMFCNQKLLADAPEEKVWNDAPTKAEPEKIGPRTEPVQQCTGSVHGNGTEYGSGRITEAYVEPADTKCVYVIVDEGHHTNGLSRDAQGDPHYAAHQNHVAVEKGALLGIEGKVITNLHIGFLYRVKEAFIESPQRLG